MHNVYFTAGPPAVTIKVKLLQYAGDSAMQALLTWIFGYRLPTTRMRETKEGVLVDKRAKVVPIPVVRDITRTKEFWDKAVWS